MLKTIGEKLVKSFDYRSAEEVAKNAGTITGAPSFSLAGIDLDGSSDYVEHEIENTLFAHPDISIVVTFTPDFDHDDGVEYFIYDSTAGSLYRVVKNTSNQIQILIGGTSIAAIAAGTYGSFWNTNQRNVLVISSTSGSTNVWLNGNQILTNQATAWTPAYPTQLFVGCNNSNIKLFDGEIRSIDIYKDLLTAEDAQSLYDNSQFNFHQKADIWLDMKTQTNDGTNDLTRDKSGKGNDFLVGDGSTASTQPSFENPGFLFDGSTDYMDNTSASGVYNNTYQTIIVAFEPYFAVDDGANHYLTDSTSPDRYFIVKNSSSQLQVNLGGSSIFATSTNLMDYWRDYGTNVVVVTGTSGDTDCFLNGFHFVDSDNSSWSPADPATIRLGASIVTSNFFDGVIYHFSTYGNDFEQKMSPTQVRFITDLLTNRYS